MMNSVKKNIFFVLVALNALLFSSCSGHRSLLRHHRYGNESYKIVATPVKQSSISVEKVNEDVPAHVLNWNQVDVGALFNDKQAAQLPSAQANGITPMETNAGINAWVKKGKLVSVSSNQHYIIDRLTHSYPYLTQEAADVINEIGRRVQQITGTRSRIIVTSLLRTKETQRKLSKTNQNAASFSCHYYGTTFDIAYNNFECSGATRNEVYVALCQAVYEMRVQKRLWVKYEYGQHCLHCTVR